MNAVWATQGLVSYPRILGRADQSSRDQTTSLISNELLCLLQALWGSETRRDLERLRWYKPWIVDVQSFNNHVLMNRVFTKLRIFPPYLFQLVFQVHRILNYHIPALRGSGDNDNNSFRTTLYLLISSSNRNHQGRRPTSQRREKVVALWKACLPAALGPTVSWCRGSCLILMQCQVSQRGGQTSRLKETWPVWKSWLYLLDCYAQRWRPLKKQINKNVQVTCWIHRLHTGGFTWWLNAKKMKKVSDSAEAVWLQVCLQWVLRSTALMANTDVICLHLRIKSGWQPAAAAPPVPVPVL